ncbi:MAG TPA: glycosyltransferase family 39 protein [Casimicrobiaceae bacterium]|nr:glycosyltransferase family 39 protein [Casimicrobiaceae bacterium]
MVQHQRAFPLHPPAAERNSPLRASLARCFSRDRLRVGAIVALLALWPWLGLFGREPWKPDEAYTFGLVWSMLQGKGLVVPLLAGEPFLEKPPLFYWVAAGLAQAFRGVLPVHEGARLAIPLFTYVALGCLTATARELYGNKRCVLAAVLFIGSLGVFDKLHLLVTDVALVAGMSMALLGFALGRRRPVLGGILLGLGAGIAFLSKGLLGPGVIVSTLIVLLFFRSWRSLRNGRLLGAATVVALPFLLLWPLALYVQSPQLFSIWFWDNNVGRFFGLVRLGQAHGAWFYPLTLLWFAFPLWVFAIRAAAAATRRRAGSPALVLPMAALGVMLAILMSAHQSRALYALPIMLPLALLALPGLDRAPREWAAWLQHGSCVIFVGVAGLLWILWLSAVSGFPDSTAIFLSEREPGFVSAFSPIAFASAALLTMLFWLIARDSRPTPANAICTWAAGLATVWGLLTTLWLPYLDYGMAYRSVAASLQQALPRDASCVASTGLGEPQRAMLDYYDELITRRMEADPAARECAWMIVQQLGPAARNPDASWEVVWKGSRPGDTRETLTLLHKTGAG